MASTVFQDAARSEGTSVSKPSNGVDGPRPDGTSYKEDDPCVTAETGEPQFSYSPSNSVD